MKKTKKSRKKKNKAVFYDQLINYIASVFSGGSFKKGFFGLNKINKKKSQALAILAVAFLILQMASGLSSPRPSVALADESHCPVDVDAVLIMDTSGSMNYTSRCDWWEFKCVNFPTCTSYEWVKNITYNQTQLWCNSKNQSVPHQSVWMNIDPKKIDAAKQAANSFIDKLELQDQSALVSFNTTATLNKVLSHDHPATKTQMNALVTGGATNIGGAIEEGAEELGSSRANDQAVKVMILLTDGLANKPNGPGYGEYPADVAYALSKAQAAAILGYKIFTIGLGDNGEINETMLQQIASTTDARYYHAQNGTDLSGIYDEISEEVCHYGSISGCKYSDANKDGDISGEEKISGWPIILNNSATPQLTDQNGCYRFSGLTAGTYTVSEGVKTGVASEQTYPAGGSHIINLAEGELATGYDFGNYLPVCGNAFLDSGNGEICEIGDTQACATGDGYQGIQNCEQGCLGWSECVSQSTCGDNVKNGDEQCDGQDGVPDEHHICTQTCTLEYVPYCGDGKVNQTCEECDNSQSEACLTQNGYAGEKACNNLTCLWEGCQTEESCGDGVKNGLEFCDEGSQNGQSGHCNLTCTGDLPERGAEADLAVTKIVDDNTVDIGQTVIFTIGVTNAGPDTAPGVFLNDLLPAGLTFVSASSTQGTSYDSSAGVWTIGDMAKDSIVILEITATVSGSAGQQIVNTAVVAIDPLIDINTGNNSASVSLTINTPAGTGGNGGGGTGGGGGGGGFPVPPVSTSTPTPQATSTISAGQPAEPAGEVLGESIKKLPGTSLDAKEPVSIAMIVLILLFVILVLKRAAVKN
jgi:uncharacterized repeat protein (TIGR01451 family)